MAGCQCWLGIQKRARTRGIFWASAVSLYFSPAPGMKYSWAALKAAVPIFFFFNVQKSLLLLCGWQFAVGIASKPRLQYEEKMLLEAEPCWPPPPKQTNKPTCCVWAHLSTGTCCYPLCLRDFMYKASREGRKQIQSMYLRSFHSGWAEKAWEQS